MSESLPDHHFEMPDVHEVRPHPYAGLPPGTLKLLFALQLLEEPRAEVIDLNRNVIYLDDYRDGKAA